MDRVTRGVGNPCPLLLIGLPASIVAFKTSTPAEELDLSMEKLAAEGTEGLS
jgi:hypothetical protein